MTFSLGKYEANVSATGALRLDGQRFQGQWAIYDASQSPPVLIERGSSGTTRNAEGAAIEDARAGAKERMQGLIEHDELRAGHD